MGSVMRLRVEAVEQAVAEDEGGSGGRLFWPAVCYLLQHWLGSQHGVCKVGQHITTYLPPSFFPRPLSHTPPHAALSLTVTLFDICFITYLTCCLHFPFPYLISAHLASFVSSNVARFLHANLIPLLSLKSLFSWLSPDRLLILGASL